MKLECCPRVPWTFHSHPRMSEIVCVPIPGILSPSWDHPGMDHLPSRTPLEKYPWIPGILCLSWNRTGMEPYLTGKVPVDTRYCPHPGTVPGWITYPAVPHWKSGPALLACSNIAAIMSSPFGKPSGSLAEIDSGYVASSVVLAPNPSRHTAPEKIWIVFSNPHPSSPGPVQLERIGLHGNRILGRVSVGNLVYEKEVYVHWTFDEVTYADTNCQYDYSESPQRDIFVFSLPATASFQLSIGYNVAAQSFSDENSGAGYRVLL